MKHLARTLLSGRGSHGAMSDFLLFAGLVVVWVLVQRVVLPRMGVPT